MSATVWQRRLWFTLSLVLGFFVVTYPLMPLGTIAAQGASVRLPVSVMVFTAGITLAVVFPSIGLPFAVGILPQMLVLRDAGTILGRGVDLFYLVIALIAWYRLPVGK